MPLLSVELCRFFMMSVCETLWSLAGCAYCTLFCSSRCSVKDFSCYCCRFESMNRLLSGSTNLFFCIERALLLESIDCGPPAAVTLLDPFEFTKLFWRCYCLTDLMWSLMSGRLGIAFVSRNFYKLSWVELTLVSPSKLFWPLALRVFANRRQSLLGTSSTLSFARLV